jgi:hypothetical protein
LKRSLTIIAAVLSLNVAGVRAQSLQTAPKLITGDTWTYKVENQGTHSAPYEFTNTTIDASDALALFLVDNNKDGKSNRLVAQYDIDQAMITGFYKYDPEQPNSKGKLSSDRSKNEPEFRFPMTVGDSYTVHQQFGEGDRRVVYDWRANIEAYEQVKIEFGSLNAYKIDMTGFYESPSTNGGRATFKAKKTIWFSPEAKREIKVIFENFGLGASYHRMDYIITTLTSMSLK